MQEVFVNKKSHYGKNGFGYSEGMNMIPINKCFYYLFIQTCLLFVSNSSIAQTITSFTPASGPTGSVGSTNITISGTGFNATPANNTVCFGAVYATPSIASATSLTVRVPTGTTYQNLSVLNKVTGLYGYAKSIRPFIPTFYNEGAMLFSSSPTFSLPYSSAKPYFKIGDIDGDGKPDIVLLNPGLNTVSVLLNTSTTGVVSFAASIDFTTNTTPHGFSIVDMDGDGKLDIVVGNSGSNGTPLSVLLNTSSIGSVSFAAKFDIPASSNNAEELTVADFDGDGKPDIGYISTLGFTVHVIQNTSAIGSLSFTARVFSDLIAVSLKTIISADFDGDGKIDLAALKNTSTSTAITYRNTSIPGTITFAASVQIATGNTTADITAGDIDGDGKPDLISTNTGGSNVATSFNTSTIGTISFATRVGNAVGTNPICVVMGDIDGDGKPDLAVSVASINTAYVLRNHSVSGAIALAAKVGIPVTSSPSYLAFCDFDGDGKPDLAIVNSSTLSVYRSLSKDKFIFRMAF